jgi:ABC-type multidrug transport system ATPase subunit
MPEAQRCDRLALFADSRLVAADTPTALIERSEIAIVAVEAVPWSEAFARLHVAWPTAALYGTRVHIPTIAGSSVEEEIRQVLSGLEIRSIYPQKPTMEDAFISLLNRPVSAR